MDRGEKHFHMSLNFTVSILNCIIAVSELFLLFKILFFTSNQTSPQGSRGLKEEFKTSNNADLCLCNPHVCSSLRRSEKALRILELLFPSFHVSPQHIAVSHIVLIVCHTCFLSSWYTRKKEGEAMQLRMILATSAKFSGLLHEILKSYNNRETDFFCIWSSRKRNYGNNLQRL